MNGKQQIDLQVAHLHGRIIEQIKNLAEVTNTPTRELTDRMGTLLLNTTSRKIYRPVNNLPTLRGKTSENNKASRKMEMARGSYRKTQKNAGIKAYWAKMTPEQRSKEMRRRVKKGLLGE